MVQSKSLQNTISFVWNKPNKVGIDISSVKPPRTVYTTSTESSSDDSSSSSLTSSFNSQSIHTPQQEIDTLEQLSILESKCTRLQSVIADLSIQNSNQDIVIGNMKAEIIRILTTKLMDEKNLQTELERRDMAMSKLHTSVEERSNQSKRKMEDLEATNSSLEDEIKNLRAENVRLQLRAQMFEEAKKMAEEKLDRDMQLLHIESSHHDIL